VTESKFSVGLKDVVALITIIGAVLTMAFFIFGLSERITKIETTLDNRVYISREELNELLDTFKDKLIIEMKKELRNFRSEVK